MCLASARVLHDLKILGCTRVCTSYIWLSSFWKDLGLGNAWPCTRPYVWVVYFSEFLAYKCSEGYTAKYKGVHFAHSESCFRPQFALDFIL